MLSDMPSSGAEAHGICDLNGTGSVTPPRSFVVEATYAYLAPWPDELQ